MKKMIVLFIGVVLLAMMTGCGHTHSYSKTVAPPSCTGKGYTTYTCDCGDSYIDNETAALGHTWGEWLVTKEPTTTAEGEETRTCSVCKTEETRPVAVLEDTTHLISTPEDFDKLVNSSETFRMTNDIDLSGIEWTPIVDFSGTLLGNGYTIKNLTITAKESNVGFFSVLYGTVQNLCFENASITVTSSNECVGILCGQFDGDEISKITVSGNVMAERCSYVGGIVGYTYKSGDVSYYDLKNSANITGKDCTGGILGGIKNDTYGSTSYTMEFSNLENSGEVNGSKYTGGVVGYLYGYNSSGSSYSTVVSMSEFTNTGAVTGTTYVGGLVGYGHSDDVTSSIMNSSNNSAVTAEAVVGTIAGWLENVGIESCNNEGSTLVVSKYITDDGEKYAYAGGLVGRGAWAKDCTNYAAIQYTGAGSCVGGIFGYVESSEDRILEKLTNHADISGAKHTGGIAGYVVKQEDVIIKDLKNSGKITGKDYTGGVLGDITDRTKSSDSYKMEFSNLENSGEVNGSKYTGGIVGYLCGEETWSSSGIITVSMSEFTNTGAVTGTTYVGGLVGYGYSDDSTSSITKYSSNGTVTGTENTGDVAGKLDGIVIE